MKDIRIRKYWSGCSYTHDVLSIPDDAKIYLVNMCNVGYKIDNNSDEFTKGYLIISYSEFEESHRFGDFYIRFEDGILIEDNTLVFDIANAPKPKDVYIYSYPYNDFGLSDIKNELFDEMNSVDPDYIRIKDLELQVAAVNEMKSLPCGITKIGEFTKKGYVVYHVQMFNDFNDDQSITISTYPYNLSNITQHNEFVFGKEPKKLYNEMIKTIYNELKS